MAHRLAQLFESLLPLQLYLTARATTKALLTTQTQGTELLLQLLQGPILLLVLAQTALLLGRQGCQLGLRLLMTLLQPLALILVVQKFDALLTPEFDGLFTIGALQPPTPFLMTKLLLETELVEL